jgi:hypothetical protein
MEKSTKERGMNGLTWLQERRIVGACYQTHEELKNSFPRPWEGSGSGNDLFNKLGGLLLLQI